MSDEELLGKIAADRDSAVTFAELTVPDAVVFDCRKGRLWHATQLGEAILTKALQLADDPHRLASRNLSPFLRMAELIHLRQFTGATPRPPLQTGGHLAQCCDCYAS
jgi:hypothetical protein